jgi:hypothetical protein
MLIRLWIVELMQQAYDPRTVNRKNCSPALLLISIYCASVLSSATPHVAHYFPKTVRKRSDFVPDALNGLLNSFAFPDSLPAPATRLFWLL